MLSIKNQLLQFNLHANKNQNFKAFQNLVLLSLAEAVGCIWFFIHAAVTAPIAILKLPISAISYLTELEDTNKIHENWIGITNVSVDLLKSIACLYGTIMAPTLVIWNFKVAYRFHELAGIFPKTFPNPTLLEEIESNSNNDQNKDIPEVTLDHYAGSDDVKKQLQESIIFPLRNPETLKIYKAKPPTGLLLYGPTGCGKTYLAKCIAGELGASLLSVSPDMIASPLIHGTSLKIKEQFEKAEEIAKKTNKLVILFFDEIESMVLSRNNLNYSNIDHKGDETNTFLSSMNDLSAKNIFVIGATNHKDKLDSAFLRSERMSKKILISKPELNDRVKQLEMLFRDVPKTEDFDCNILGAQTADFNSADLVELRNETCYRAMQKPRLDGESVVPVTTEMALNEIKTIMSRA